MGLSNTHCNRRQILHNAHVGYVIVDCDYSGYPSNIMLPFHGHVGHVKEYSMSEPTSAVQIHLANTFKTRVSYSARHVYSYCCSDDLAATKQANPLTGYRGLTACRAWR